MARIVVALGGNALGNSPREQEERVRVAAASLVRRGTRSSSATATVRRSA